MNQKMNLKKKTMTVLFLILVTLGASAFAYSQDWPMFGQNPQNTGYSPSPGPSTGDLQWVHQIKGNVSSSPVVVDGKVYIGATGITDGKLYCLDAYTGAWIWEYTTTGYIDSSPTVADNEVYISSEDGNVSCLNADTGVRIWETQIGPSPSSPVMAEWPTSGRDPNNPPPADDLVIICSEDGNVYFLNADNGDIVWVEVQQTSPVEPIYASPIVADGRVYYAVYYDQVRVMTLAGYVPKGGYHPDGILNYRVVSSPAVADGKLYVGSENHRVSCFDLVTRLEIWNFQTGDRIISSPAVADGEVYICSGEGIHEDGKVYCLDAYTGALIWEYTTETDMTSSPAVADNKVYISGGDGRLYCLNADTGAWIWDYFIEDELNSPVVADGKVYITSYSGKVYCIGSTLEERIASLEARVSEPEIKFMILPGERLNIYNETVVEYTISADETTNVWHGFRSRSWDNYTEEQKTEFLSTAQWRFTVDGEEVPLDHVVRLQGGFMWSVYYRVFPPGYFKIGTHRLVGEWHKMEDEVWTSYVREAKLRVK